MGNYTDELKQYVNQYLKMGLTVIRLAPHSKTPMDKWKEDKLTITNIDEKLSGEYNVGIVLGADSGFIIVFDFESVTAFQNFYIILQDYGLLDLLDTWIIRTGKGVHVYYSINWKDDNASEMLKPIPSKKYFQDLEVRGEGNYVVAPPSIHPSGARYEFIQGPYLPIKTIGSKEYATLLYLYAKTGDINATNFEELYEKLRRISPSVFELDLKPSENNVDELSPNLLKIRADHPVNTEANVKRIYELIAPLLPYVSRQDFSLTLFTTLARLGLHPLRAVELLALLLQNNEYIRRRSSSDSNEVQEAKRRVEVFSYSYDNVWRTLRGRPLEEEFPNIYQQFAERLKQLLGDHFLAQHVTPSWFLKGSGERALRGLPTLTEQIASALVEQAKAKGEHLGIAEARERAWLIAKEIAEICRPERKRLTQLERQLQVYQIGSTRTQVYSIAPGKSPSQQYVHIRELWLKKFPDQEGQYPTFRVITKPIIYRDKHGVIRKGARKEYYFKLDDDEFKRFLIEYDEGVPLTAKPVEVARAVFYRGVAYIKLYVEGAIIEGSVSAVVDKMVQAGLTTSYEKELLRKYFTWISQTHHGEAFLAPGIYEVNGKFVATLPNTTEHLLASNPLVEENIAILKEWASRISEEDYEKFLKAIIDYKEFLPSTVYYTAMSYLAIAGFLHSIVDVTGIKPALYILGKGAGTGKTHLATFIAVLGYGSSVWSQSAIKSNFRFDVLFSSSTFPVLLDDVHTYDTANLRNLKGILTSRAKTFRGSGIDRVKFYELAAVPVFTANDPISEFYEDPALADRLITLKLTRPLTVEEKIRYRATIDAEVGVSRGVVYAPYFVRELVEVVNALQGKNWIKQRFNYWYKEAAKLGIVDGRDPQKFATLMVGAETLSALLSRHGLTFDVEEAKVQIAKLFLNKEEILPIELEDIVFAIDLKGLTLGREDGWVVTGRLLRKLRAEPSFKGEDWHIPRRPKELAEILYSLGYTKDQVGPKPFKVNGNTVYGVLIPAEIIDKILAGPGGEVEEGEEEVDLHKVMDRVVNHLSMGEATFEELTQAEGIPQNALRKALVKLEQEGVIWVKDGRYRLINRKKAKEMGSSIVETLIVSD